MGDKRFTKAQHAKADKVLDKVLKMMEEELPEGYDYTLVAGSRSAHGADVPFLLGASHLQMLKLIEAVQEGDGPLAQSLTMHLTLLTAAFSRVPGVMEAVRILAERYDEGIPAGKKTAGDLAGHDCDKCPDKGNCPNEAKVRALRNIAGLLDGPKPDSPGAN
jgi:hypothetical protein